MIKSWNKIFDLNISTSGESIFRYVPIVNSIYISHHTPNVHRMYSITNNSVSIPNIPTTGAGFTRNLDAIYHNDILYIHHLSSVRNYNPVTDTSTTLFPISGGWEGLRMERIDATRMLILNPHPTITEVRIATIPPISGSSVFSSTDVPYIRRGMTLVRVSQSEYYIFGSDNSATWSEVTKVTVSLNPFNITFTPMGIAPRRLSYAGATYIEGWNRILIIGGLGEQDNYLYNPTNDTWQLFGKVPQINFGLRMILIDDELYATYNGEIYKGELYEIPELLPTLEIITDRGEPEEYELS